MSTAEPTHTPAPGGLSRPSPAPPGTGRPPPDVPGTARERGFRNTVRHDALPGARRSTAGRSSSYA